MSAQPASLQRQRPAIRGLELMRPYRSRALLSSLAVLLVTVASLASPQFLRLAIDEGIIADDRRALALATAGLVGVAVVRSLLNLVHRYLAEWVAQYVACDLRDRLFVQIGRLGAGYHDRVHSADLMTRLTGDIDQVKLFYGSGVIQFVASLIAIVGASAILLWMNWQLALVALLPTILMLVALRGTQRLLTRVHRDARSLASALTIRLHEALVGMRVIRAYGRERYEIQRYDDLNQQYAAANVGVIRAEAIHFPLFVFFANLGLLAAFWLGGERAIAGDLSVGELVAFNAYLGFLLFPTVSIVGQASTIARATASLDRVIEVLDAPAEIQDAPDAIELDAIRGEVTFADVRFRYPGTERDVLKGISLTVAPGQRVALVGRSGAGKSTLLGLLVRFYDVSGGAIRIDGVDIRKATVASLRRQVGMVLQQPVLFRGTVWDNLTYGVPDANHQDVVAVARIAQVEPFVAGLSDGYQTIIGERGVGLSGGQRQRIAIARTVLVRPRILVLDESTSAIDAATEAALKTALAPLIASEAMTTFIIAHRVSTVRDADLVVMLDDGQIVATGTHAALLADRRYRQLMAMELSID